MEEQVTKISTFLSTLRNDVFKLLPMKEAFNEGKDNHISDYIYSLIVTAEGALVTFKELDKEDQKHVGAYFQNQIQEMLIRHQNM